MEATMADRKKLNEDGREQEGTEDNSKGQYGGLKGVGPGGGSEIEEADPSAPDAESIERPPSDQGPPEDPTRAHDERVRRRAHEIWDREGRPEGRESEHWRMASAEIDAEDRS
jgi:Protein of unknown function (DUF2934)